MWTELAKQDKKEKGKVYGVCNEKRGNGKLSDNWKVDRKKSAWKTKTEDDG